MRTPGPFVRLDVDVPTTLPARTVPFRPASSPAIRRRKEMAHTSDGTPGSSCLGVQYTTLPYVNRSPERAPIGSARCIRHEQLGGWFEL